MTQNGDLEFHEVSAYSLQRLFNQQQIVARAAAGELTVTIGDYDYHLNRRQLRRMNRDVRTRVRFPYCTRSQYVIYQTLGGALVATGHRYRRPDGALAGSGRVNPHWLWLDGHAYTIQWL